MRHNEISNTLSTKPESFEPLFLRTLDGEVDARPWCMGFYEVMKLRLLTWSRLMSPNAIEHVLLLPILFHCVDASGRPVLNPIAPAAHQRPFFVLGVGEPIVFHRHIAGRDEAYRVVPGDRYDGRCCRFGGPLGRMKLLGRRLRADPDLASGGGPIDSQRHEGRDRVPWDNGISLDATPSEWSRINLIWCNSNSAKFP